MLTVADAHRQDSPGPVRAADSPVRRATDPDWSSAALLTIDTQVDTLDGQPLEIPGTSAALPAIAEACQAFRLVGAPIVHVLRLYLADGTNAELCRQELVRRSGPILRPGTDGSRLAPPILPSAAPALDAGLLLSGAFQELAADEFAMYKPRWGAFFQTGLDDFLVARDITTVVVVGCNFPNCPRTTIYEASERDYRVVLVEDAVSGLYDRGRAEMLNIGVQMLGSHAVRQELGSGADAAARSPRR